jgi:hypothetical protein
MIPQRALAPAFAAVIFAAHCHCVVEHAWALPFSDSSHAAEQPLSAPTDCENESGCICQGATLATNVDLPPVMSWSVPFDGWASLQSVWVDIEGTANLLSEPPDEPQPYFSARKLRALLQTFLI